MCVLSLDIEQVQGVRLRSCPDPCVCPTPPCTIACKQHPCTGVTCENDMDCKPCYCYGCDYTSNWLLSEMSNAMRSYWQSPPKNGVPRSLEFAHHLLCYWQLPPKNDDNMKFSIALGILCVLCLAIGQIKGCLAKDCDPCSLPWQLAYQHDGSGIAVSGWKYSLVSAVLSGARVRVVILGSSYSTEADNVHVHGDHVFAQLLQHVSKASWNTFQNNVYWWWAIVSTSGAMQMTRYNVGSNTHRGTNSMKTSI
ncbi:hypothetical protein ACROYT_G018670 [Oculina patagonica]